MSDYGDLVRRLRGLYVQHGTNYVQQAADAIEALQRDAARYRWLRDRVSIGWNGSAYQAVISFRIPWGQVMTLDVAIDAAMKDAP